jgi:hypothetical protein
MTMQRSGRCWSRRSRSSSSPRPSGRRMSVMTHVEALAGQQLRGFGQRGGGVDAVALAQQRQLVQRAQVGFVVHHQDARRGSSSGAYHQADCVKLNVGLALQRRACGKLTKKALPSVPLPAPAASGCAGSRCWRHGARTVRGRCTGPGRWSGSRTKKGLEQVALHALAPAAAPSLHTCRRGLAMALDVRSARGSRRACWLA